MVDDETKNYSVADSNNNNDNINYSMKDRLKTEDCSDTRISYHGARTETSSALQQQQQHPTIMNSEKLLRIPLIPLNCTFGIVNEDIEKSITLQDVIRKELKNQQPADVTLVFAIRRTGCGSCREHARDLLSLEKQQNQKDGGDGGVGDRKLSLLGIIKSTEHPDRLLNFYNDYFKKPIYKDTKWNIYHALGNRKISFWEFLRKLIPQMKKYKKRNVVNQAYDPQGDVWTQGGVLLFNKAGQLKFVYYETFGESLDLDVIRNAIKEARK